MARKNVDSNLTLRQLVEDLKKLNCTEITRILPYGDFVTVEFNTDAV